jgi:hypothetical protein
MAVPCPARATQATVAILRRRLKRLEGRPEAALELAADNAAGALSEPAAEAPCPPQAAISLGPPLDAILPEGGLRRGWLVEWLAGGISSGAPLLALLAARQACRDGKMLLVVDRARRFYPPAAAAWGIDLARLAVVQPASEADELWAIDQALRCRGVGAVWSRRGRLDDRDFRRLQLAAESGGTLGLLVRPASVRGEPSWAHVQLLVSTVGQPSSLPVFSPVGEHGGWRLRVEVTRCRGGHVGQAVELEIDERTGGIVTRRVSKGVCHETHPVHPAAELAHSAAGRRGRRVAVS